MDARAGKTGAAKARRRGAVWILLVGLVLAPRGRWSEQDAARVLGREGAVMNDAGREGDDTSIGVAGTSEATAKLSR